VPYRVNHAACQRGVDDEGDEIESVTVIRADVDVAEDDSGRARVIDLPEPDVDRT